MRTTKLELYFDVDTNPHDPGWVVSVRDDLGGEHQHTDSAGPDWTNPDANRAAREGMIRDALDFCGVRASRVQIRAAARR